MGTFRAVKIVYRASFDREKPFEREFTGIQKFEPISRSHSALVDILQIGRTPDCFYYVMELADDATTGQEIDPARYQPRTLRAEVVERGRVPLPGSLVDLAQRDGADATSREELLARRDQAAARRLGVPGHPPTLPMQLL